jgi:hypothetical protein
MPRYAVLQNYGSGTYGPWEMGTQVELDEDQAVWVNRDSPGTLARVKHGQQLDLGQPVPAAALEGAEASEPAATPVEPASAAASTKDEGAPVASSPRGRRSGTAKK